MAIDSMNKVIHAAVRRDLGRLEQALALAPEGDRARADALGRAWANLDSQLRHHHMQEDTILFPALLELGVDAFLLEAMESEHTAMTGALSEIDVAISTYAASASTADATSAADAVHRGTAIVDSHLAHEEGDLEPFMVKHADAPQWQAAMKQVRRQPPARAGTFFAWLQDGNNDEVRAYLESEVPKAVRFVFGRVFGRGYQRSVAPAWR